MQPPRLGPAITLKQIAMEIGTRPITRCELKLWAFYTCMSRLFTIFGAIQDLHFVCTADAPFEGQCQIQRLPIPHPPPQSLHVKMTMQSTSRLNSTHLTFHSSTPKLQWDVGLVSRCLGVQDVAACKTHRHTVHEHRCRKEIKDMS